MVTWNDATPPVIAKPGPVKKGLAMIRAGLMLLLTLFLLPFYLVLMGVDKALPLKTRFIISRFWARALLAIMGVRWRQKGRMMKQGGAIVSNHVSFMDILTLLAAPPLFFVSKAEVKSWPVFGQLAVLADTVFIERKASEAARQQKMLEERLTSGQRLCFYPEGTSTDGLRVLPFKSALFGAFMTDELKPHLWVQPVTLAYHAPKGQPAEFFGWWGDMPLGAAIWNILNHGRGGMVEIIYAEPLRAQDFANRKQIAAASEAAVRAGIETAGLKLRS